MSAGPHNDPDTGREGNAEPLSIGRRLVRAREARQLSIERVADTLNLDVRIVAAMERDDREALPSPIFVKGYLRGYAALVGLPADDLVREYKDLAGEPPPLTVVRIDQKVPFFQLPSTRLLRNIILILLAAILVWLAYPFLDQLMDRRVVSEDTSLPGRLELPPAGTESDPAAGLDTE